MLDNFEGFEKKDIFDQLDIVDKTKTQVLEHLKRNVRPEFLNRIDEIIMFRPLTKVQIRKIVDIQFRGIQKRLTEAGITIEANKEALNYMGEKGYDPVFGARPLKRVMQQLLLNTLSKEILAGNVRKDAIINVTLDAEGKIAFENIEEVLV
jgi:ATP-dependent Clp protease ATP-binding subunit ClpB